MDDSLTIPPYTQHDLLWMKLSPHLLSRSAILTDPLMTTLNIMLKDTFFITSNRPVQEGNINLSCRQRFAIIDMLLMILWERQLCGTRLPSAETFPHFFNLCIMVIWLKLEFSLSSLEEGFAETVAFEPSESSPSGWPSCGLFSSLKIAIFEMEKKNPKKTSFLIQLLSFKMHQPIIT